MDKSLFDDARNKLMLFCTATELKGLIVDEQGERVYTSPNHVCSSCSNNKHCKQSRLFGARQSEAHGGSYIFFCPLGLVHFVSPIMHKNHLVGALFGGPILMTAPDQWLFNNCYSILGDIKEVSDILEQVQVLSTQKVHALSEVLKLLAQQVWLDAERYQEAQEKTSALNKQFFNYIERIKTDHKQATPYDPKQEKQLLHYIRVGNKKSAEESFNQVLTELRYRSKNLAVFKARVMEVVVMMSRALMEKGSEVNEILGYNHTYLDELQNITTEEDLISWITMVFSRFTDAMIDFGNAKHMHAVHKAIHYMHTHYMNHPTLVEVAEHVHFTSQYFSKIFKETTGLSFNKYLNKIKIEKSLPLLEEDLHQSEIAYLVGFSDQSHYSRHFKSVMGMTPRAYKMSQKDVSLKNSIGY